MTFVSKYFCPTCNKLTYSLRYIFQKRSQKPKGSAQYCRKCDRYYHVKANNLRKIGGD